MHTVKLPEMEWRKYDKPTRCTEAGWYARFDGTDESLGYYTEGCIFPTCYEFAGPIKFEMQKPMPELLQLKGCSEPKLELVDSRNAWHCISHTIGTPFSTLVSIAHEDRRTTIMAYNAAVSVMIENAK